MKIVEAANCLPRFRTFRAKQMCLWPALLIFIAIANSGPAAERMPADYVDPLIGTSKSRWFYFSSACRPFGMVSLSPDTSTGGDWMNGYIYGQKKIRCFSHVHDWQLYGIPVLPITGEMRGQLGMDAYASDFSHNDEVVHPGYHKVVLKTYGVTAELTSTTRVGFHRYTFPSGEPAHVLFDIGAALMAPVSSMEVHRVSDRELSGYSIMAPTPRRPRPFTVYFIAQFDRPFSNFGAWTNGMLVSGAINQISGTNAGAYVSFGSQLKKPLLLKVAISYTSLDAARHNMDSELPHWDFDRVVRESREDWNKWLGRIEVSGGSEAQRVKFYTDLWHALLGRHIISDADGSYCDMTGAAPIVRRVACDASGEPLFPQHNFDALWGSQWSLNILWSFAYPEVMDAFCNTMVDMYRNGGLIPRGPAGGNYTYVMIGDPAAPFFAAAYNKGIRHYDAEKAYEGLRKNALPGGIRDHAGYEHDVDASGGGMREYVDRGYVPENIGGRGMHKDGASMTLEYAYEDWCLAQLAIALGKKEDADWLLHRSMNYTNLWDAKMHSMRPRLQDGSWLPNFAPAGASAAKGFCEANAAIYTHFVPQDIPGLVRLFGGAEAYVGALNHQFELSEPKHFFAQEGNYQAEWVNYGNQPSTEMAHLFNLAGAPWLSQKWVRAVKEQTFGDTTPDGGYNGDEDQGQMGSLGVLMAIGLFDVQGGAEINPKYQITTPIFDHVTIHLHPKYFSGRTFTITPRHNSPGNVYIQSAKLNGANLNHYWISHTAVVNGGSMEIVAGPKPSRWATAPR